MSRLTCKVIAAASLMFLQGCAVVAVGAAIGAGMGTGAPRQIPPETVEGVQINFYSTTCGDLFGELGAYRCENVFFFPAEQRTFDERLRLAGLALTQRLEQDFRFAPKADIVRVTQEKRNAEDAQTTLFLAYSVN